MVIIGLTAMFKLGPLPRRNRPSDQLSVPQSEIPWMVSFRDRLLPHLDLRYDCLGKFRWEVGCCGITCRGLWKFLGTRNSGEVSLNVLQYINCAVLICSIHRSYDSAETHDFSHIYS